MDQNSIRVSNPPSGSRLANAIARAIYRAFDESQAEFRAITRRAKSRFSARDWHGMHADSVARLGVYEGAVDQLIPQVVEIAGERLRARLMWGSIKAVYSGLISDRHEWEIAETFYNSVTRRIFATVGVDEEIEFVHSDYECPPAPAERPTYLTFVSTGSLAADLYAVLNAFDLPLSPEETRSQAADAAVFVEEHLRRAGVALPLARIEVLKPVFYRGEDAYLIGRLAGADASVPLVVCLRNTAEGAFIDAVLLEEADVSSLFSFARSYFSADAARPFDMVQFIKTLIPRKPRSEIYNSIGYKKHGKTELYRHALRHLASSTDQYQLAEGQRGMVMVVFTMPSYPVVYKIIKDHFDYPKETTRQAVMDCYRLVAKHDRAGRLVDAQEYQYLTLDRRRFDEALLDELLQVAAQSVRIEGERVVITHCYAERRVTPLNVYLQEVAAEAARAAVIDYGQTIKDLACTNIFPGDLLLKNFGVTRQRRLVYYDYDEVCLLTDCTFRELPQSDDSDDAWAEPWFGVGKYDVFPEEFAHFLGLLPPLRCVFLEHHADLLTVPYWREMQQRLRSGQLFHLAPYPDEKRLPRRPRGGSALSGESQLENIRCPIAAVPAVLPAC